MQYIHNVHAQAQHTHKHIIHKNLSVKYLPFTMDLDGRRHGIEHDGCIKNDENKNRKNPKTRF